MQPFYDPTKSYEENYEHGPFGLFAEPGVFENKSDPKEEFLGHKVYLPFGIPAGPVVNGRYVQAALDKGYDLVVYKTVRTASYACHPWPNVLPVEVEGYLTLQKAEQPLITKSEYSEPLSITNSFGVPSFDPSVWQPDLKALVSQMRPGQLVIGSFQGTKQKDGSVENYIQDFITGARLLKETGVPIMEVNLSCPNEGSGHLLCFDTERTAIIVEAIKNEIGSLPLIIKVAYFADQEKLKTFVQAVSPNVDGISAINTIPAEIRDSRGEQALPGEGRLRSGVCGAGIRWAGLEMVARLKQLREDLGLKFAIVGVGGVMTPEDYFAYRKVGADAVMSATGAMWNPALAQEIKGQLLGH